MPSPEQLVVLIVIGCAAIVGLVLTVMKGKWRDVNWSDPTILAAIIAGSAALGVAVAGAISGSISAAYQSVAEREKTRGELLEKALLAYERVDAADLANLQYRISILLSSGIISDDDGAICKTIIKQPCPVPRGQFQELPVISRTK